jgi:hypothetical protein
MSGGLSRRTTACHVLAAPCKKPRNFRRPHYTVPDYESTIVVVSICLLSFTEEQTNSPHLIHNSFARKKGCIKILTSRGPAEAIPLDPNDRFLLHLPPATATVVLKSTALTVPKHSTSQTARRKHTHRRLERKKMNGTPHYYVDPKYQIENEDS